MSTTIHFNSATPQEVYNLTLAFQRTSGLLRDGGMGGHLIPAQVTKEPTVTVGGSCMGWTSPGLTFEHSVALMAEYDRLQRGVWGGPNADDGSAGLSVYEAMRLRAETAKAQA